jgi:hypothetical protein
MPSVSSSASDTTWSDLSLSPKDLEFIYNLLLDREVPLTTREMALALIAHRLERRAREAEHVRSMEMPVYLPESSFAIGEEIRFAHLANARGRVLAVRPGANPDLGTFEVIQVELEGSGGRREFATRLDKHALNQPPEPTGASDELETPESVMGRFGPRIEMRLQEQLAQAPDIVRIAGRWFPKALLAEIHAGHLNLAEAVLDVAGGGPLPTEDLLKELGMPPGLDPLLAKFSLDFALQTDERFDEVGPAGQVLWFLRRLEPPEVQFTPPRLEPARLSAERGDLTEPLRQLERDLDDELSPLESPDGDPEAVTLPLLFCHWRVGTLPLSSRLRPLFPTAYEAPRIRFILVDGHTGERFPGWVVREPRYVHGLEPWYRRHEVPAGGLVRVRKGQAPGEVVVETIDRRRRNDWIRTIRLDADGHIGFSMLKQPVGAAFDELMVIGLTDPKALDQAWLKGQERRMPIERLVAQVFRELARLNPQSAVHAQALYSAVNVIQRIPPAPIFQELMTRKYYAHVGDLYWRFDESAWSAA